MGLFVFWLKLCVDIENKHFQNVWTFDNRTQPLLHCMYSEMYASFKELVHLSYRECALFQYLFITIIKFFKDNSAIKRLKHFLWPGFSLTIAYKWIRFNLQCIFLYSDISWEFNKDCFYFVSFSIKKHSWLRFEKHSFVVNTTCICIKRFDKSYSIAETMYLSGTSSEDANIRGQ